MAGGDGLAISCERDIKGNTGGRAVRLTSTFFGTFLIYSLPFPFAVSILIVNN